MRVLGPGLATVFLGMSQAFCVLRGATVWTGPLTPFNDPDGADPTLPQNQDRLTANVWITRGVSQGIYNARTETGFAAFFSPAGTEWANGELADYASLTYTNWNYWAKGVNPGPPSTVGVQAVVHLISDDIYLSVNFTSWGLRAGGFSWVRSTPATSPPPPSAPRITNPAVLLGGSFRFSFTNTPNLTFTVLVATNPASPRTNWTVVGTVTNSPAGSGVYQFTNAGAAGSAVRGFYQVRYP
jgi:hypothetical protein